jgi:hypothetical protein
MLAFNRNTPKGSMPRPHHRMVVPDAPESWTLEEVDYLLWPNDPDHQPQPHQEEGWPELLGRC